MNRYAACAAMFLAVGLLSAEEPKNEWVTIAPEKLQFEIQFPAKPKDKSGNGSAQFILERDGGKAGLSMQANTFPSAIDIGKPELVKTILDNGARWSIAGIQGKQSSFRKGLAI